VRAREVLCLLFVLPLLGCGRIERTRQCMQLIESVNGAVDDIAARQDAGALGAHAEREIATRYEQLATELEARELDTPGLAKTVAEYRDVILETSRLVRRIADARDRSDPATLGLAKRELGGLARREKMLATRIDSTCQSP
jgi:hypothetical protein